MSQDSKTVEELQAELDLLREQEAQLEAEARKREDELAQDAEQAAQAEEPVYVGEPFVDPAQPGAERTVYREHGRMGEEGGV